MAGVHALRGTSLPRDRRAGADAAAPDALAEPRATTARPQDRPHPRKPLRPARRTPDTVRGHAARRRLPGPGQPVAGAFRQGRPGGGTQHPPGDRGRPDVVRTHLAVAAASARRAPGRPGHHRHRKLSTGGCDPRFRRRARQPSSEWRTPFFGIRSRAETRARRRSSESEAGPYST